MAKDGKKVGWEKWSFGSQISLPPLETKHAFCFFPQSKTDLNQVHIELIYLGNGIELRFNQPMSGRHVVGNPIFWVEDWMLRTNMDVILLKWRETRLMFWLIQCKWGMVFTSLLAILAY